MKLPTLLALGALSWVLPACTTVHDEVPTPTPSTTSTTQSHTVRTPVGGASTSTTVNTY